MRLEELIPDISQMSDEELMERIGEIRKRRAAPPVLAKRAKKKKVKKAKDDLATLLSGMQPCEIKELLNKTKK